MLAQAIRYGQGEWALIDIYERLLDRTAHLWALVDDDIHSVMVTIRVVYPQKTGLLVLEAAGKNAKDWVKHEDQMRSWAKKEGYDFMEAWVRKGWKRILPHWQQATIVLRRDL